jgi:hypothetical protein
VPAVERNAAGEARRWSGDIQRAEHPTIVVSGEARHPLLSGWPGDGGRHLRDGNEDDLLRYVNC